MHLKWNHAERISILRLLRPMLSVKAVSIGLSQTHAFEVSLGRLFAANYFSLVSNLCFFCVSGSINILCVCFAFFAVDLLFVIIRSFYFLTLSRITVF